MITDEQLSAVNRVLGTALSYDTLRNKRFYRRFYIFI